MLGLRPSCPVLANRIHLDLEIVLAPSAGFLQAAFCHDGQWARIALGYFNCSAHVNLKVLEACGDTLDEGGLAHTLLANLQQEVKLFNSSVSKKIVILSFIRRLAG